MCPMKPCKHPLCSHCQKENKLTKATVVDHIISHRGDFCFSEFAHFVLKACDII